MVEHIVSVSENKWNKLLSNFLLRDNDSNIVTIQQPMTSQSKAVYKPHTGGRV